MEYCFEGLKRKENLFLHISALDRPESAPLDTLQGLKDEVTSITEDTLAVITEISSVGYSDDSICSDYLWSKTIVGNQNSTLSEVIERLGNSDWVEMGQKYIDGGNSELQTCPFCQSKTITPDFIQNLKLLFDESYEADILRISKLQAEYSKLFSATIGIDQIPLNDVYSAKHSQLKSEYGKCKLLFEKNKQLIDSKVRSPSKQIKIDSLNPIFGKVQIILSEINELIKRHNQRVEKRDDTLKEIGERFWKLMRWNYDGLISGYRSSLDRKAKEKKELEKALLGAKSDLQMVLDKTRIEQKKTVNISEAVERIKNGLLDLGIDGFTIENHRENLYRIVRPGGSHKAFHSLSEGERMIIQFPVFHRKM